MGTAMVEAAEKRHQAKAEKSVINKLTHALGGEDAMFALIASGMTVTQLCKQNGVSEDSFWRWIDNAPERGAMLTRARAMAADHIAESGIDLIKQAESALEIRKAEVQTKYGQWLAKCWNKETYGDSPLVQVNITAGEAHLNALRKRATSALDASVTRESTGVDRQRDPEA